MGGMLWYSQGKWRMKPAYYTNPVLSLNEDDLRSSVSVSTRHSRRDNFNTVKGVFRGPETNYQPTDYTPVTDSDFLTIDGNQESVLNLDLPYTDDFDIARRLALITLERNRQQITVQASFGLKAFRCQVGDIIQLTNSRFGWTDKEFEVISWTFGLQNQYDLQVQLTLRETSENVFDDISDGALLETDNTELADPKGGLLVTNVSVADKGNIQRDGTFVGQAEVSWTAVSNPYLNHYEVQWKDVDETAWFRTEAPRGQTSVIIGPLETGVQYNVRVRAVTVSEVKGSWVSATAYTHGGDTTAPSPVTGLSATGGPKNVTLDWTAPTTDSDASTLYDLKGYHIYRSTSNSQPANPVAFSGSDKYVDGGLSQDTQYYYWVTAVDFTGNESTAVASGAVSTDAAIVVVQEDTRIYTGTVYYQTLQATAPSTPSATTFNETTLTFGNLTSGWATTQPFVDATSTVVKEWSSKYKVEFDIDDNVTITFTTPDGAFQITDDIESDNYVAGSTGWRIERDTGFAEFGSAAIRDTLSVGQIPNLTSAKVTDLGSLATQNTVDYNTEVDNTPDLSAYATTSQLNSKSTVIYDSSTPSSTSTNDLWYKTTEDRYYRYNGSSWVPVAITADSIVASYVYAGVINATQINSGTLNVDRLPGLTTKKFDTLILSSSTSSYGISDSMSMSGIVTGSFLYAIIGGYKTNNGNPENGVSLGDVTATLSCGGSVNQFVTSYPVGNSGEKKGVASVLALNSAGSSTATLTVQATSFQRQTINLNVVLLALQV
jgi:fibronectin type 3 domain-containing protein